MNARLINIVHFTLFAVRHLGDSCILIKLLRSASELVLPEHDENRKGRTSSNGFNLGDFKGLLDTSAHLLKRLSPLVTDLMVSRSVHVFLSPSVSFEPQNVQNVFLFFPASYSNLLN